MMTEGDIIKLKQMPCKDESNTIQRTDIINTLRHSPPIYVEIEAKVIARIRDKSQKIKKRKNILADILLGLSTTFFGTFLANIEKMCNMIKNNTLDSSVLIDFVFLIISLVLFFVWYEVQKGTENLIDDLTNQIEQDLNDIEIPTNEILFGLNRDEFSNVKKTSDMEGFLKKSNELIDNSKKT